VFFRQVSAQTENLVACFVLHQNRVDISGQNDFIANNSSGMADVNLPVEI
jgi:hypothetical protein